MSHPTLSYLQIQASLEQGKSVAGSVLSDFFSKVEMISQFSWKEEVPEFLLKLEFGGEFELEGFSIEGVFEVVEIISQTIGSALVVARLKGPVVILIHQINNCWLQTPSTLSSKNGLFLTLQGTSKGLKLFRDGLKHILPDSIRVRITKDLKADWIAAPKLPKRRKEVINLAVRRGYYKTPRKCTQRELADELGVRQGTIAEHLQSAESLIIESWSEQSNS